MTATEFLSAQILVAVAGLCLFRRYLRERWVALLRVLLFVAAASFSFDYIANDRGIWAFTGDWNLQVLINPFENSAFAVTMAILLILIYSGWASRTPRKNR